MHDDEFANLRSNVKALRGQLTEFSTELNRLSADLKVLFACNPALLNEVEKCAKAKSGGPYSAATCEKVLSRYPYLKG